MKRFLTILLTTLALSAVLCVSASASNFDSVAEELSAIGMFKGTAGGFDLDKVPTRGQAAIMLVRLYGAEQAAQNTYSSGRITCPFTDVSETVAPYVAWLVDEGIANGTTATTFGASEPCTARAYTIFLLRALGYQDETDFTAVTAQDFAAKLGLLDTSSLSGTFLRDDVAAMTYQALGLDRKSGDTYLLDHLIKEGFIDANDAYPIVEKIENARALSAASAAMDKGLSANIDANMSITVTPQGAASSQEQVRVEHSVLSCKGNIKMIPSISPQIAYDLNVKEEGGNSQRVQMWMQNGWLYLQTGDEGIKMEIPEMADAYEAMMSSGMPASTGVSILPFVEYMTAKDSGTDKVYSLEMNDVFVNLLNSAVVSGLMESGLPGNVIGEFKFDQFKLDYTVKNGALKTISADVSVSVDVDANMGQKPAIMKTVGISMQMKMDVAATGATVKITYPDFSKFEEVIGGADQLASPADQAA